jgi:hypothetical protein
MAERFQAVLTSNLGLRSVVVLLPVGADEPGPLDGADVGRFGFTGLEANGLSGDAGLRFRLARTGGTGAVVSALTITSTSSIFGITSFFSDIFSFSVSDDFSPTTSTCLVVFESSFSTTFSTILSESSAFVVFFSSTKGSLFASSVSGTKLLGTNSFAATFNVYDFAGFASVTSG